LKTMNRDLLRQMQFSEVRDRLSALGIVGEQAEPFWMAVCGNLDRLADSADWWRIVQQGPDMPPELSQGDADYIRDAFAMLPAEPWDRNTFKAWMETVKQKTGRKGKALYAPVRLVLTGLSSGPELADL